MKKAMTILYKVHNNLYVNLTNQCPCACTFCLRQTRDHMEQSDSLWLEHEPTVKEVLNAFQKVNMEEYQEVVFCGFGEPTQQIDILIQVALYVKKNYHKTVRVNTNGLGNLIHGKNIAPMFQGAVDIVSISLNTPEEREYNALVRSRFGEKSYQAMLQFAQEVKKYVSEVIMTTVETTITKEQEEKCWEICDGLGVTYRIRPFED